MGIENKNPEEEVEGVVDLEAELISALEELRKYKRMDKQLKIKVTEFEEKNYDSERMIVDLKNQLQKSNKGENSLEQQLKTREQELEKVEAEIVLLRKKIDEESFQSKFVSSSKTLDDILSCQSSSSNKTRLGYDKGMKSNNPLPQYKMETKIVMLMYSKT